MESYYLSASVLRNYRDSVDLDKFLVGARVKSAFTAFLFNNSHIHVFLLLLLRYRLNV